MGGARVSDNDLDQLLGPNNFVDHHGSLSYLLGRDLPITDYDLPTLEALNSPNVQLNLPTPDSPNLLNFHLNLPTQEAQNAHILEAASGSTRKARAKRDRSENWSPNEKRAYLEAKLEAVRGTGKGKQWEFISRYLQERHGFSRSPKECENLWGTLLKKLRAIIQHEKSKPGGPQTSDPTYAAWVSYFEMDEESRSRNNFLPLPFYQLMDTILEKKKKRPQRGAGADHGRLSHTVVEEADDDAQRSIQQCLESFIAEKVEDAVNSSFESLPCRKTCRFSKPEQDELWSLLAPDVKQLVEATVNINLKILASEGYRFDAGDPTAELAPFVEKFIKDALRSAVEPVSSALEAQEQKKLEVQKKRQEIYEKRRTLDLEEKEIEEGERLQHVIGRITKRMRTAQQSGRQRRRRNPPPRGAESSRH